VDARRLGIVSATASSIESLEDSRVVAIDDIAEIAVQRAVR